MPNILIYFTKIVIDEIENKQRINVLANYKIFTIKIDLVKSMGIGGVWVDAINYDDLTGVCSGMPYPAITYIKSLM